MISRRIKSLIPASVIRFWYPTFMKSVARKKGYWLNIQGPLIDIGDYNDRVVRIAIEHAVYLNDIVSSFDYYFNAVEPLPAGGRQMVDYSTPRYHDVVGFDHWPVMFPSFAEPIVTASQYLHFAALSDGMSILDLGAYSGLTSILFSMAAGENSSVIAVEPDPINLHCIRKNVSRYNRSCNSSIQLIEGAVWRDSNGIEFSSEGNMGGSAASIVGRNRGRVMRIRTLTLSEIVRLKCLSRVDFIKCDVEGAEAVIFEDKEFFRRFRPRIVVEPHVVNGELTADKVTEDLSSYGYRCQKIRQDGVHLPLIECSP